MMRQVSKEDFFAALGNRDVHPVIRGTYPYTQIFRTKAGMEVGRIFGLRYSDERMHPVREEYFLTPKREDSDE